MSEHPDLPDVDTEPPGDPAARDVEPGEPALDPAPQPVRTGVPGVDEVLVAVEELEDRPVEEHVGVFEAAHDQLRRALDAPGEDPA